MINREEIWQVVDQYKPKKIAVGSIGSHSALDNSIPMLGVKRDAKNHTRDSSRASTSKENSSRAVSTTRLC
jgi:hypothetical protein